MRLAATEEGEVMSGDGEMTLGAWLESKWATRAFRVITVCGSLAAGYAGTSMYALQSRMGSVENSVTDVRDTQGDRANDQETFQKNVTIRFDSVNSQFADQGRDLDQIRSTQLATAADIGMIKGLLQKQLDVASLSRPTMGR